MAKNNYPQSQIDEIEPTKVQEIVTSLKELHDMGQPKTDSEVESRINQYFQFCEHSSVRPGVESLCLSLHITRQTLLNWANGQGCSEERQKMAQTARGFLAAYLEQVTMQGRLNPASSCFMFKNWFNYRDNITVEPVQEPQRRVLTAAELPRLGEPKEDMEKNATQPPKLGDMGEDSGGSATLPCLADTEPDTAAEKSMVY